MRQNSQPEASTTKKDKPIKRNPQKITQLQCYDQNLQLKDIFIKWSNQSFKYLPNLLEKIYLQIQLIINFIEYRFTISKDKPQVGDYLQNLKYKNLSKHQKVLFLILQIILPYLRKRLVLFIQNYEEKNHQNEEKEAQTKVQNILKKRRFFLQQFLKKLTPIIRFIDKILSLLNFLNLAIFINKGQYRTFVQRILKIEMQFMNPQSSRVLNFTLMNRTLIWGIYDMVLKNILPFVYKFVGNSLKNIFYLHSYLGVQEQNQQQRDKCIFCGQKPTMILQAEPCRHKGCFYCFKNTFKSQNNQINEQNKTKCKKCDQIITSWKSLYSS